MVAIKKIHIKHIKDIKIHKHVFLYTKAFAWFVTGVLLGFFFLVSFAFIFIKQFYSNAAYPGVSIGIMRVGGMSKTEIENYFLEKNAKIGQSTFTLSTDTMTATVSAKDLGLGFNANLLAEQAISVGRSPDVFSNMAMIFQAFLTGITLPPSYTFSQEKLTNTLQTIQQSVYSAPTDAQFAFANGRVTIFTPSQNGKDIDIDTLTSQINTQIPFLLSAPSSQNISLAIPIKTLFPKVTTEKANNLGIKELIGTGTSLFQHSIPSRIYNVELAAKRLNGIIVAPNEEFSFDKALGDVSSYTGYQQAYVISGGKTVLGDGGGVCQVSTTMFRAILNAGLPVTERHAHDYRVGYYEEDGPPGIDATVYVPTVDLKFKNDTGHNILIQTVVDPDTLRLTFYLYGVKDGREVSMTTPVISNESPAPAALYQDDPTLPKGTTKQVDFSADGATVKFNRIVKKNGEEIINETYVSNYRPWQAVYLVGTGQ